MGSDLWNTVQYGLHGKCNRKQYAVTFCHTNLYLPVYLYHLDFIYAKILKQYFSLIRASSAYTSDLAYHLPCLCRFCKQVNLGFVLVLVRIRSTVFSQTFIFEVKSVPLPSLLDFLDLFDEHLLKAKISVVKSHRSSACYIEKGCYCLMGDVRSSRLQSFLLRSVEA